MEFEIRRASAEDVEELADVMKRVADGMEHPEWFIQDDAPYICQHIGSDPLQERDCGFILKAVTHVDGAECIAGFFMVDIPGLDSKNLGYHVSLQEAELLQVAHMDSVVILPEFRGNHLQQRLMEQAENVIREQTHCRILMATVHPENRYSLSNVQSKGYQIVAEAMKYGGYPRYILKKEIS